MEEPQIKKSKMSSNHQMKVDRFMMWAKDIKIELNKKVGLFHSRLHLVMVRHPKPSSDHLSILK